MKKSKKIFLRVLPVLIVLMVVFTTNVFAAETQGGFGSFTNNMTVAANKSGKTINSISNVWGIILTVLQVAAIAAVVFAGVRYMFASADSKADIKKQMIWLVIGAILVFGASTVIQLITNFADDLT